MAEVGIRAAPILLKDPVDIQLIPTPFGFFESYSSEPSSPCNFDDFLLSKDNNITFSIEEYADQIFYSMNIVESKIGRVSGRITEQRAVVIEWMTWVCTDFGLSDETLAYSVLAFDEFTSMVDVDQERIQLIAAVCLWIASKMEERYIPALDDFVTICDNKYSKSVFIQTELNILDITQFDINKPTAIDFIDIFSSQIPIDEDLINGAKYFCNVAYCWDDYSLHRSSHIALSCLILAKLSLNYKTNLLVLSRILHDLDLEELCLCCVEIFNSYMRDLTYSINERHLCVLDLISLDPEHIGKLFKNLPETINDLLDI